MASYACLRRLYFVDLCGSRERAEAPDFTLEFNMKA